MADRLAELGALQYAVENLSTAGTNPNRLGLAGYIHAAYTDYQTWAAANPGVNPNRLSARGRIYGYFYDNASWSPSSLFANSEVGAWYDPSDLTTMFQDSTGTTPVTADGQSVGLILDKSKGLVLGSDLVDTANTTAPWSAITGTATIVQDGDAVKITNTSAGIAKVSLSAAGGTTINLTVGKFYRLDYQAKVESGTSASFGLANVVVTPAPNIVTSTTYLPFSLYISPSNTDPQIRVTLDLGEVVWIRGISVKELTGNHASQATAASRPLYKTDGTYHWLQFDGVDDSLSTAAIDFTSTDKMSVFCGVTIGDNTSAWPEIFTVGTSANWNTGTNIFGAHSENGYLRIWAASGTSTFTSSISIDNSVAIGVNAPSMASAMFDYGASTKENEIPYRKVYTAGTAYTPSYDLLASLQSGMFPNNILHMGGVFNGNTWQPMTIRSLIIRGALSTTQEITDTETWVNSKCGAF